MSIIIFYDPYLHQRGEPCFDWRPIGTPLPANATPCAVVADGQVVWRNVPRCEPWQWAQYAAIDRRAVAL